MLRCLSDAFSARILYVCCLQINDFCAEVMNESTVMTVEFDKVFFLICYWIFNEIYIFKEINVRLAFGVTNDELLRASDFLLLFVRANQRNVISGIR